MSSFVRIPALKDAVASDYGSARSLWLTPDNLAQENNVQLHRDLAWSLGFPVPTLNQPSTTAAQKPLYQAPNAVLQPPNPKAKSLTPLNWFMKPHYSKKHAWS